MLTDEWLALQT